MIIQRTIPGNINIYKYKYVYLYMYIIMYVFPHCVLKGTTYIFFFEDFLSSTQNLQKVWDQINVLHVPNRSYVKWDINCFYWHYSLFYFNLVIIICLGHMGERCWRSFSHRNWLEQNSRPSNPFCSYYCCFGNIYVNKQIKFGSQVPPGSCKITPSKWLGSTWSYEKSVQ